VQQAAPQLKYTHRSYSQVKQLRTCGYQFKLERIDQVPRRPGAASVAGTALHTATELIDHELLADPLDTTELNDRALTAAFEALDAEIALNEERGWPVDSYRSYGYRPKQDIAWYRDKGIPNSINAYIAWRFATPDFVLADVPHFGPAIEVPFNYYVGDQLIHGRIDRIFTSVERGGYYPIDIKSGNKPPTDEQLGLYAAALHKALDWTVTWGYYLYNLKRGEAKLTPPLRVDHWTDEKLGEVYLPATKLIDLGIYIPSPGENCMHCDVADSCPFSQAVV
jgi:hypothetical protein